MLLVALPSPNHLASITVHTNSTDKASPMDPLEIEDTSDWLGCPTELETCRHYLRMLENEVQELTLQLRKAREDIFGLVEMHAEVSRDRDQLRAELAKTKSELADSNRRATDIETKSNWELMANNRHISELTLRIREHTGEKPFASDLPSQRDISRT
jgi:chromosome segregation ATPase